MSRGLLAGSHSLDRWGVRAAIWRLSLALVLTALLSGGTIEAFAADENVQKSSPPPVPLNPEGTVSLDRPGGKLLLKTRLCLREGILEMLICPRGTKEHEAILSLDAKAQVIHAGLLALGAKPGKTAKFVPEFQKPEGQEIEIVVTWKDAEGKTQRRPAQEWVRHAVHRYFEAPLSELPADVVLAEDDDSLRYDAANKLLLWYGPMSEARMKELRAMSDNESFQTALRSLYDQSQSRQMDAKFVFAGSEFQTLEDGKEIYMADGGSLICVANFGDAMIDVNIESTSSNDLGLLFEPWAERLPELGTEVIVELKPVLKKGEKETAR